MQRTGYLAPEGFERELRDELGEVEEQHGRLFITRGPSRPVAWAQNVWLKPHVLTIRSITDGARQLRDLHAGAWAPYSFHLHRRLQLIQQQLPKLRTSTLEFLASVPTSAPASWTLIEPEKIIASPSCTSVFPNGEMTFKENRSIPPSRAYLKLWELFTVHGVRPERGSRCLDLGSSPGGWTWVLQNLGARVIAVDRAPLDPKIAKLPGIEPIQHSAFTLAPETVGPVDWLFSDIICEPSKLFDLVQRWRASGLCQRFVCTIKFKGATDHETTRRFAAIPGSKVLHLHHNKHELTWFNLGDKSH